MKFRFLPWELGKLATDKQFSVTDEWLGEHEVSLSLYYLQVVTEDYQKPETVRHIIDLAQDLRIRSIRYSFSYINSRILSFLKI